MTFNYEHDKPDPIGLMQQSVSTMTAVLYNHDYVDTIDPNIHSHIIDYN